MTRHLGYLFRIIPHISNFEVQLFAFSPRNPGRVFLPEFPTSDCLRNNYVKWPNHAQCRISQWHGQFHLYTCRFLKWTGLIFEQTYYIQKMCDEDARNVTCPNPLKPKSDIHCNRSATSPRPKFITIAEVAEESQLGFAVGRRLVGDWSATDRGLVAEWSATGRRPRGDLFATWCN